MKFDLSKERNFWFLLGMLGISYLLFLAIQWVEQYLPETWKKSIEMFHFFTIPAIFYLLLKSFEKYFWKWNIWKIFKIIDFPDLNGMYDGKFISSFKDGDGRNIEGKMTLRIKQTASDIVINGSFNLSESVSTKAFFSFNDLKSKVCLYYFFKNKPNGNVPETMHAHEGSAILCYDEKTGELKGEYYSGRDRNNYGDIEVKKIDFTKKS